MTDSIREVLALLRQELAFLDRGGYGGERSWKPLSIFLDSPSCPNRLDVERRTPCAQCWLSLFVPDHLSQDLPSCHFIPLDHKGESIRTIGREHSPAEVQAKLKGWLEAEIRHLEQLGMAEGHVA